LRVPSLPPHAPLTAPAQPFRAPQNLAKYRDALAAAVDASIALAESVEIYFEAPPGGAAGVADPASLLLARSFATAARNNKESTLPAAAAQLDGVRGALEASGARYGVITPRVEKRKTALLEFDAYKRKVEALRAAPPKNDPDKLPRNEEKLTAACSDLAAANDDLISHLIELEKAKPAMLASSLPVVIAAAARFHAQAADALAPALAKAVAGGGGEAESGAARKGSGVASSASPLDNPFGAPADAEEEVPVMSFTPSTPLSLTADALPSPPPASAPHNPFVAGGGGGFSAPTASMPPPPPPPQDAPHPGDPFAVGADDDAFGVPLPPPPPPPPFPPPAAGGVPGVDDFDNF
jgi:hypothetical protein